MISSKIYIFVLIIGGKFKIYQDLCMISQINSKARVSLKSPNPICTLINCKALPSGLTQNPEVEADLVFNEGV